jgi:hypothetical protein
MAQIGQFIADQVASIVSNGFVYSLSDSPEGPEPFPFQLNRSRGSIS